MLAELMHDVVIDSWRRIAMRAGLRLEIRTSEPLLHGGSLVPATVPRRTASGWEVIYPEGCIHRVHAGTRLIVELPESPGSGETEFLLQAGAVSAMVIWTCGYYPLHAAGFHLPEGLAAIFAEPGGGKSTLAALALADGIQVHGDDLLALTPDARILGLAGSLRIAPCAAPYGWHSEGLLSDGREWYPLSAPAGTAPLRSLLRLQRGATVSLSPIKGHRRLSVLLASGFLSRFDPTLPQSWHTTLLDLSGRFPVWELQVPDNLESLHGSWPDIRRLLAESCG